MRLIVLTILQYYVTHVPFVQECVCLELHPRHLTAAVVLGSQTLPFFMSGQQEKGDELAAQYYSCSGVQDKETTWRKKELIIDYLTIV